MHFRVRQVERTAERMAELVMNPDTRGAQKVFRKQFLPSGLPTNERFVRQTIVIGRNMMPGLGDALSEQQLDDLIAYLRTL